MANIEKINKLFDSDVAVINVGIRSFHEDLRKQKIASIHVDFKPPAGGNKKLASLLSQLS
ncbi:MAG TPA: fdrA domain protein [Candidatus Eisenbacteria bacterium]|nr:fdrA domain protein [Candidatus Eisenbacteria bacterium]